MSSGSNRSALEYELEYLREQVIAQKTVIELMTREKESMVRNQRSLEENQHALEETIAQKDAIIRNQEARLEKMVADNVARRRTRPMSLTP